MKISLDALLILDAIDRYGGQSAAATALHRVPSALSHTVRKLEEQLGVRLYDREARRAVLTEAGRTLLEDGRHLLRAAGDLERRVQRVASGWEPELRIAVNVLVPAANLVPLLAEFSREGHGTALRIDTEVLGGCWDALATQRCDLVVGATGEPPVRGGIATRLMGEGRLLFTMAPDHPLAALPEPIPAEERGRYPAVVLADSSRQLAARSSGLVEGQAVLRVPDMETKAAAQAAGLGTGHLPRWLAEREVAAGRLCIRELAETRPPFQFFMAWRARQTGKALDWFRERLSRAQVQAALLAGL